MKEKRASPIIFVVPDDASRSAVLFQTADPTWVAFNRYGGSSLYGSYLRNVGGGGGGGAAGSPDNPRTRAYIVSYNRPLDNRSFAVGNQFFNGEYPAVAWLERNGYDVSYSAGVDSDRRGERIKDHKIFVSAGHDTYWSAAQRANIESARDAGVNLAFLAAIPACGRLDICRALTATTGPIERWCPTARLCRTASSIRNLPCGRALARLADFNPEGEAGELRSSERSASWVPRETIDWKCPRS
jgi:hypothetical protein